MGCRFPCFFCVYYYHINPDDDGCKLHDKIIFYDTLCCDDFACSPDDDLISVLDLNYNF